MCGEDIQGTARCEVRIGCTDLAEHGHDLIVFDDPAGLVLVFPPDAWAVFAQTQSQELCAALVAPADDGEVSDGDD